MSPDFWSGRRVFLTGHTGFKGTWLAVWLNRLGAKIFGYALPPATNPNAFDLARVGELIVDIRGDVRRRDDLGAALATTKPEIIIHMAAQSLVRESYVDPIGTLATNIMGTAHVLESARYCPDLKVVLVVTSDKCYRNAERAEPYREDQPLGGHDPYSASKGCAEIITESFRGSYFSVAGPAIASARAGNVIGGGDWAADRLVPDLIRAFTAGRRAQLRCPEAVRPWQHVLEPLHGYLALCEHLWRDGGRFAEAWNFGPAAADARPVRWIADRVSAIWGQNAGWNMDTGAQPHEARMLLLDSGKATVRLGWSPRWDADRAVEETVAWYRRWHSGEDARSLMLEQIAAFKN